MSWNRRVWATASAIAAAVCASAPLRAQSVALGWTLFPSGLSVGSMTAAPMGQAFVMTASPSFEDVIAALGECAPCKANSRPFYIPPGWIFRTLRLEDRDKHGNSAGQTPPEGNGVPSATGTGNASSNESDASLNAPVSAVQTQAVTDLDVSVTPEPASLALIATGLIAVAAMSRRRRRS